MKLQLRTDDGDLLAEKNATTGSLDMERRAGDTVGRLLRGLEDPRAFIERVNENNTRHEYGLAHENGLASLVFYRVIDGTLYKAVGGSDDRNPELIRIREATDFGISTPPGKVWLFSVHDFDHIPWDEQCPDCGQRGRHRGAENRCSSCMSSETTESSV